MCKKLFQKHLSDRPPQLISPVPNTQNHSNGQSEGPEHTFLRSDLPGWFQELLQYKSRWDMSLVNTIRSLATHHIRWEYH